jgi:rod shape-determining protein MreD
MTKFLPALAVLFAVVATAVPWGLPADATFILPLVVVMMIFCWRAIPGTAIHPAAATGLGLLADLMSGGPLGYWALMGLVAATVGGRPGTLGHGRDLSFHWMVWMVMVTLLAAFGWLLASAYYFRWIDWWPIAFGALASVVLFPIVLYGLLWIRNGRLGPERSPIYRGWS